MAEKFIGLSHRLEMHLRENSEIDTGVQKGFLSSLQGMFEHVYSLSAIMQDDILTHKHPLMTFKNVFGSVSHQLIFDILKTIKAPSPFISNVQSAICYCQK